MGGDRRAGEVAEKVAGKKVTGERTDCGIQEFVEESVCELEGGCELNGN
jgi:hypothetical protein